MVLASSSVRAPVDEFTRNLARTLLVQAGLAIERTRDREALREATLHGELTKLGNRRKANARIESLAPGDSLMMIDQSGEGAEVAGMRLCGGWRLCDPMTTFSTGIAIHSEE